MKVSEVIAQLTALQAEHGDIEFSVVAPEGQYTRLEGKPDILGIGWQDSEGEYLDLDSMMELVRDHLELDVDDDSDVSDDDMVAALEELEIEGPFICLGQEGY